MITRLSSFVKGCSVVSFTVVLGVQAWTQSVTLISSSGTYHDETYNTWPSYVYNDGYSNTYTYTTGATSQPITCDLTVRSESVFQQGGETPNTVYQMDDTLSIGGLPTNISWTVEYTGPSAPSSGFKAYFDARYHAHFSSTDDGFGGIPMQYMHGKLDGAVEIELIPVIIYHEYYAPIFSEGSADYPGVGSFYVDTPGGHVSVAGPWLQVAPNRWRGTFKLPQVYGLWSIRNRFSWNTFHHRSVSNSGFYQIGTYDFRLYKVENAQGQTMFSQDRF